MVHTSPSRRARRGRALLLGLVALFIISLMATVPAASADEETLVEKIERRTGLSGGSTLEELERRTDPPGSDHVDSVKHKLSSLGSGGGDGNETQDDAEPQDGAEPQDDNDTARGEDRDKDGSKQGSRGNESGKDGPRPKNVTEQDLDSWGVECPPASTDSCEPPSQEDQAGSESDDAATGDHKWTPSGRKNDASSTPDRVPDDKKDDTLAKTATGSGIVMVLAWTLFVASTGPLGRSGKDGENRRRPQVRLTPESQQQAQETESRANPPSRQAPSRRR